MKLSSIIFLIIFLFYGCKSENILEERDFLLYTYKYSVIQDWTGNWNGSEFIDTVYAGYSQFSMIFLDDAVKYLMGYRDGELVFAREYSEYKNLYGDCELYTGDCVKTMEFYQNGVIDGRVIWWIPPDEDGVNLYSEFPLTAKMLNLPEGMKVWNVYDIQGIN